MVDKVKNAVQIPWRQNTFVYPYKGLNDPQYIKDRDEIFAKNGNGWWWRWTKENTPIPGIYSPCSDKKYQNTAKRKRELKT